MHERKMGLELENKLFCCSKNLSISKQEENGDVKYIIKNRITEKFYVFSDLQYHLLCAFDGNRTMDEVCQHMNDNAIKISKEQVETFAKKLYALHLFEGEEVEQKTKKRVTLQEGNNLLQRLLYIRINLLNPDSFLDKLYSKVGFVFTLPFFLFFCVYYTTGLCIFFSQVKRNPMANGTLAQNGLTFLLLFLTIIISSFFHELAHALVCRKYGGKVTEIGMLIMYFQVGLYCNVSDSYLFKDKRHRILVSLAGIYMDSFLWTTIMLLCYFFHLDGIWQTYYEIYGGFALISVFVELNPLLKFDGYYVLAELLNEYNLRDRAFGYVRSILLDRKNVPKYSNKTKRIYFVYAIFASVYGVMMLGSLFLVVVRFLIVRFGVLGGIVSVFLIVALFSKQVNQGIGKVMGRVKRK